MGARETALNALIACRKDGAWSNSVLKTYTLRDGLDRREAALASRLCYGVLQNRGKLDGLTKLLMERETIDRKEFEAFMKGEALPAQEEKKEELSSVEPTESESGENA